MGRWLLVVLRVLAVVIACVIAFDVPSAYLVSRGWSPWVALAAGLATFPVVPLVWHLVGERARRRSPPKKSATKGWERLLMRCAGVGVLVIAIVIGIGRGKVWTGVRYHALWFVPDMTEPLTASSPMFDYLPPSTTGLVWLRGGKETRAQLEPLLGEAAGPLLETELMVGVGDDDFILLESGDLEIVKTMTELFARLPSSGPLPFQTAPVTIPGGRYWATSGWAAQVKTGRPSELFAMFARVPADAFLVAVARKTDKGKTKDLWESGATAMIGYVRVRHGDLVLAGKLDFESDAKLEWAESQARRAIEGVTAHKCAMIGNVGTSVRRDRMSLEVEITVPSSSARELARCLDKN